MNTSECSFPQRAMSAAAMLAGAADQIIMGGFASLSPTNPLVVVPTMGGSMMLPAQAVVDERNELLHRLQGPDGTGENLMSLRLRRPLPAGDSEPGALR